MVHLSNIMAINIDNTVDKIIKEALVSSYTIIPF